jgi:hypothetical protein
VGGQVGDRVAEAKGQATRRCQPSSWEGPRRWQPGAAATPTLPTFTILLWPAASCPATHAPPHAQRPAAQVVQRRAAALQQRRRLRLCQQEARGLPGSQPAQQPVLQRRHVGCAPCRSCATAVPQPLVLRCSASYAARSAHPRQGFSHASPTRLPCHRHLHPGLPGRRLLLRLALRGRHALAQRLRPLAKLPGQRLPADCRCGTAAAAARPTRSWRLAGRTVRELPRLPADRQSAAVEEAVASRWPGAGAEPGRVAAALAALQRGRLARELPPAAATRAELTAAGPACPACCRHAARPGNLQRHGLALLHVGERRGGRQLPARLGLDRSPAACSPTARPRLAP